MLTAGSKRRAETRWMVLSKMMVSSLAEQKARWMVPNLESSKHLAEQKVQRKVPTKCLAEKMVVQRLMVVRLACLIHLAHPKVANLAEMKWKVQWKAHRMVASLVELKWKVQWKGSEK